MSETILRLCTAAAEGALRRVFGTVEHRGFHVRACRVDTDGGGREYRMQLVVEGVRDPALLVRQLMRLHDVRAAHIVPDVVAA